MYLYKKTNMLYIVMLKIEYVNIHRLILEEKMRIYDGMGII
jgi:hypothetical protein